MIYLQVLLTIYVVISVYNVYLNFTQKRNQEKILMHEKQTAKFISNWENAVRKMENDINTFILSQQKRK